MSCESKKKSETLSANDILQKTIKQHASSSYQDKLISFTLGDTHYTSSYSNNKALFTMNREHNSIRNKVIYDGGFLKYYKNDSLQEDGTFPYQIIERSLFGLLYSLSIPHNLTSNDIKLQLLEDVTIRSKSYYALQARNIDYQEEKDNIIILYISKQDYLINYIALDYNAIALQKQFRRLSNPRRINDILFHDTTIFVSQDSALALKEYYTNYNNPRLKHTKDIVLENIEVKGLN